MYNQRRLIVAHVVETPRQNGHVIAARVTGDERRVHSQRLVLLARLMRQYCSAR